MAKHNKIGPGKGGLTPKIHGLYRRKRPISEVDGRTRQAKAWKVFSQGIINDLGELSFSQMALAETCFLKFYILSDSVRLLSKKKDQLSYLFFNRNLNTAFNCTSNSFRLDLEVLYSKTLKQVERRLPSLEQYLKAREEEVKQTGKQEEK